MQWIRTQYGVPAKRGRRITFQGRPGRIKSASGGYLRLELDTGQSVITHPTWEMDYYPDDPARCPIHGNRDCSPLLNGCSSLTA